VVKPPDRQGQKGLSLVQDAAGLERALAAARGASRSGVVLVEEFVDGQEVAVTGFSVDGEFVPVAVSDRWNADPPAFGLALAYVWPSAHAEAAIEVARRAVQALGVVDGPSYTRLRVSRGGPEVIDVAARLGGGHDAELVQAATGVRLNDLALDFALGLKARVEPPQALHGGACVLFLVAPEGELRAVEGREEAHAAEGVLDVRIYREPGYAFGPFLRGADRAGAVLAVGASRDEALARARVAADAIRFDVG
jgi:biotin carboxylase